MLQHRNGTRQLVLRASGPQTHRKAQYAAHFAAVETSGPRCEECHHAARLWMSELEVTHGLGEMEGRW